MVRSRMAEKQQLTCLICKDHSLRYAVKTVFDRLASKTIQGCRVFKSYSSRISELYPSNVGLISKSELFQILVGHYAHILLLKFLQIRHGCGLALFCWITVYRLIPTIGFSRCAYVCTHLTLAARHAVLQYHVPYFLSAEATLEPIDGSPRQLPMVLAH